MPEHNDQCNKRERSDTRYQVENGPLSALTHAIFHSPVTKHNHRRHVCKAEKLYFVNSEASCLQAPVRQLFVLRSEPSLKIPFRMLGARRCAGWRVLAPSESRQSYSVWKCRAFRESTKVEKRRGCDNPRMTPFDDLVRPTLRARYAAGFGDVTPRGVTTAWESAGNGIAWVMAAGPHTV
jgi:hypothetical protein